MENFLREGVDLQGIGGRTIAGDAHFFEDATTPAKVRAYLDSAKEAEKLKGMKWLLAMLSKGCDVSEFFPDVVKNVVVKSVEVKKMVYLYLVHYADYDNSCREIALLSINSFQKDMSGTNQLIRGLALRVMTSIRVPDVIQIQLLAVRKCATDSSPYVRKCAANALPKIYALDPEQLSNLKQIMEKLLKDSSTMVLGRYHRLRLPCPCLYYIHAQQCSNLCFYSRICIVACANISPSYLCFFPSVFLSSLILVFSCRRRLLNLMSLICWFRLGYSQRRGSIQRSVSDQLRHPPPQLP